MFCTTGVSRTIPDSSTSAPEDGFDGGCGGIVSFGGIGAGVVVERGVVGCAGAPLALSGKLTTREGMWDPARCLLLGKKDSGCAMGESTSCDACC